MQKTSYHARQAAKRELNSQHASLAVICSAYRFADTNPTSGKSVLSSLPYMVQYYLRRDFREVSFPFFNNLQRILYHRTVVINFVSPAELALSTWIMPDDEYQY